ncbi:MAG: L,D-transpeptidase family protein [Ilumatobacteraceae bacterium]
MNDPKLHPAGEPQRLDRRPLVVVGIVATVLCAVFALTSGSDDGVGAVEAAEPTTTVAPAALVQPVVAAATTTAPTGAASTELPDLDGSDLTVEDSCLMKVLSVRFGDTNDSVSCLQQALAAGGFYGGSITGQFDAATFDAVESMQGDRDLFVDGVVGRESAISLGIWPDEESFVVRTPKPSAGAVDLMGFPLSSVASAGADAPALPPNSGSGRRLVYDRAGQRVWAVGKDGQIIRSWLVSGSKYSNELPGVHEVYSRSDMSTAWNGKAYLPQMVRWLKTDIGAIGFHSIPLHIEDNSPYQTEAELGTRLSGGCQRQAPRDADFLWEFAQVGTPVIVV